MNIYVANILVTLVWGLMLLLIKPTPNKRRVFIGLTTVQWILISGLRGMSVSPDMYSYKLRYQTSMYTSWKQVFRAFYDVYVNEEGKDPGYTLFEKVTQIFVKDYQAYLFIVAVIFFCMSCNLDIPQFTAPVLQLPYIFGVPFRILRNNGNPSDHCDGSRCTHRLGVYQTPRVLEIPARMRRGVYDT